MLGMVPFRGRDLDPNSFPFYYPFGYSSFVFSVQEPLGHEWTWIFKTRIHISDHGMAFSNSVFFWVISGVCSPPDLLWVLVIILSCPFLFPYFTPKLFCFLCIRLLVSSRVFPTYLSVELSFLFWKALFCLYCLAQSQYLLLLPSFANIFRFISLSRIVRLVYCFILVFSYQSILAYFSFLNAFACCYGGGLTV